MPPGAGFSHGCGLDVLGEMLWEARNASLGNELRNKEMGIRNGIPLK
jgi:hypothetical protein